MISVEHIDTAVLVARLTDGEPHEAGLCRGAFRCTHFLVYDGATLYDEGIDGEECETTLEQFAVDYAGSTWEVRCTPRE